jgi:hypothetical protein
MPVGSYEPPAPVQHEHTGLRVDFRGEDGRQRTFRLDELPLPGWHEPLAAAWAARTGPSGRLRTLASVRGGWGVIGRLLRFLDSLPAPPTDPSRLAAEHLEGFFRHRAATTSEAYAAEEVRDIGKLLRLPPLNSMIPHAAMEYATRRWDYHQLPSKPGYSTRELGRLLTTARRDVAGIRDRIQAGGQLLARHRSAPDTLTAAEAADAARLAVIAETGAVPADPRPLHRALPARKQIAERLFLTMPDLTPLLVLLVAVTGRNIETIKELPAEHRILDGRAVELRLTKRRRGIRHWTDTVTWEIGPTGRELRTPGGLYLLLHRLCARGRGFSGSERVWSVWRSGHRAGVEGTDEHYDPFGRSLHGYAHYLRDWVAGHDLRGEPDTADADPPPLSLDFNRLKTSIDVRRTRQLGGHLPSAARSNTIPVLFTNYLRGDASTIEWAHEIVSEAVVDAEQAALDAHRAAMRATGGGPHVLTDDTGPAAAGQDSAGQGGGQDVGEDAAWSRCTDPHRHPATGTGCRSSFLDCFHCGNCLITTAHLPRLLALLDALAQRRHEMPEHDWWARYGPAWAAIRHDVLSKFSPAELNRATADKPSDALLDLVEAPWEHP